jgi:hypothetical protein
MDFDEEELLVTIRKLPPVYQGALACASAQRLLPEFEKYFAQQVLNGLVDKGNKIAQSMEEAWGKVILGVGSEDDLRQSADECLTLLPDEDDRLIVDYPYAEDAVASLVYAMRALLGDGAENAMWSIRRAYEAVDSFVIHNILEGDDIDEAEVLAHPLVQAELLRQHVDLSELQECYNRQGSLAVVGTRLKDRAISNSRRIFQSEEAI